MSDTEIIPIPSKVYNCISSSLLNIVNSSGVLTDMTMLFNDLEDDKRGIMLFPIEGSKIAKKFIFGNYIGQYPFAIRSRTISTDANERQEACDIIDKIGDWFTEAVRNKTLTAFDAKTLVRSIEQTSTSTSVYRNKNNTEDYQGEFLLKFERKV